MPTKTFQSIAVRQALRKLGRDIREARKRRRWPIQTVAERAFTSRQTVQRIEQGDPVVGVGICAAVINCLGLLDALRNTADPATDELGLTLSSIGLPQRIRTRQDERG